MLTRAVCLQTKASNFLKPYVCTLDFVGDQLLGLGIYSNYIDNTHLDVSETLVVLLDLGHGWFQASRQYRTKQSPTSKFPFVTSLPHVRPLPALLDKTNSVQASCDLRMIMRGH